MKEYTPPIASRSDNELYDILTNYKDWDKGAVVQAKEELEIRGYSPQKINNRVQDIHLKIQNKVKTKARLDNLKSKKLAEESYSFQEVLLYIFLLFPLKIAAFFIFESFGDSYDSRKTKKNNQKIFMIITSLIFWGLVTWVSILFGF